MQKKTIGLVHCKSSSVEVKPNLIKIVCPGQCTPT